MKGKRKRELRTGKFKEGVVRRMMAGEPVAGLSRELKIARSLLYRWRQAYRKEGTAGFRPIGRSGWDLDSKRKEAVARLARLECKIGQQALVIDFLQRAFKRVEGLRRPSTGNGESASMERSRP
jgi:transposase